MRSHRSGPGGRGRQAAARLVLVAAMLVAAGAAAPWVIRGRSFGRAVEWALPALRGRVHVGGGSWSWPALLALARGRPAPFSLEDVRLTDPQGREVLAARRLSGRLALAGGRAPGLTVEGLRIEDGRWRWAPLRGSEAIGFLAALEPASPPAPGPPAGAAVMIAGAELAGVDVSMELPDWAISLEDLHGRGWLRYRPAAPPAQRLSFEVRGAEARAGGLRVLPLPRALVLPFSYVRIDSVATLPAAPDELRLAAQVLVGRSRVALAGTIGGVYGVEEPPAPTALDLRVRAEQAADLVQSMARSLAALPGLALEGPQARLDLRVLGPLTRVRVDAEADAFQVAWGALRAEDVGLSLVLEPRRQRLEIGRLRAFWGPGGRIDGELLVEGARARAGLAFIDFAVDPLIPPALVRFLGGTLNGRLWAHADTAAESAAIEEVGLVLTRPRGAEGPRVVRVLSPVLARAAPGAATAGQSLVMEVPRADLEAGVLQLPRVRVALWGGLLALTGRISLWDPVQAGWLSAPVLELTFEGRHLSAERLLGIGLVEGPLSFRARARGPLHDLTATFALSPGASLAVLGEPFRLPPRLEVRVDERGVVVPLLRLEGLQDCALAAGGRIGFGGRLALEIDVQGYRFERLPGMAQTTLPLAGRLSGRLRLGGLATRPQVAGRLVLEPVSFQGRPVGSGAVVVRPGPHGALLAEGRLAEGIGVEGRLLPGPRGVRGDARLELEGLRLDPFLAMLPAGFAAVGDVSGTITTIIAPGSGPRASGNLRHVTLTLLAPAGTQTEGPLPATELVADGQIRFAAEAGEGALHVGPARFSGPAGTLEIAAVSRGLDVEGTVGGRVELAALAPLFSRWLEGLTGSAEVDLTASRKGTGPLLVNGELAVAAPIAFRPRRFPVAARIPGGRLLFSGQAVETRGLPLWIEGGALQATGRVTAAGGGLPRVGLTLAGDLDARVLERLAPALVRSARGNARVHAQLEGGADRLHLRGRMEVGRMQLALRALEGEPLMVSGGELRLDGRTLSVRGLGLELGRRGWLLVGPPGGAPGLVRLGGLRAPSIEGLDLPLRGGASLSASGLDVERSRFALRLRGDPRRGMRLSGQALVLAARARATGATPTAPAEGWLARPELARTALDVRLRSHGGAIRVEVPWVPDLHVDVDQHLSGTARNPQVAGRIRPADLYSAALLWVRGLFQ